ncbi:MAG: molybdenum cofactor guanylyltransferase [Solirubrobacterales bacterium]
MSSGDRDGASTGAVLAGGRSSRMGTPKGALELAGRPLITYPIEALVAAGLAPIVVAKEDSGLPQLDCPIVREPDQRLHPAAGVLAALEATGGPVVVVACDMPFVPAQLLAVLARLSVPAALPVLADRPQPLLAHYEPSVASALERAVARNEPMREAVAALDPVLLGPDELAGFGDPDLIAFNVNDRDDLAAAEQFMTAGSPR